MFTKVDAIAAIVGLICALFSHFYGPRESQDGANALLGFASGASSAYLGCMAYAVWQDGLLLEKMLHTNPVMVFGAFVYGAYINARTVPGFSTPSDKRRFY